MATERRYLLTARRPAQPAGTGQSPEPFDAIPAKAVVRKSRGAHRVVALTEREARDLADSRPDLLVEEDQPLQHFMPMPGLGLQVSNDGGTPLTFRVADRATGEPLQGVAILAQGATVTSKAYTDQDGVATLRAFEGLDRVIVSPAANYWSRVVGPDAAGADTTVGLDRLEPRGAGDWTRALMGIERDAAELAGAGVKVAIIDGGIAAHPDLRVAGGFNALDGQDEAAFDLDDSGHGTHCAGIIAGQGGDGGVAGIAPGAEIYSLKVFPGGRLSDLVEAIHWSIENRMDVLNMSLGLEAPSQALAVAIEQALAAGIVPVAAAGNGGGAVRYPAAFDGVLGVGALGMLGQFPEDSGHALRVSELSNPASGLFFANFSCTGAGLSFLAPGVAVISSVPGGYAAWDGTSMASPFVAGLAAVALGMNPQLRTGGPQQALAVHHLLAATATDLQLPPAMQGDGLPTARPLLAQVLQRRTADQHVASVRRLCEQRSEAIRAGLARSRQEIQDLLASLA